MRVSETPLIDADRIAARVAELGAEISQDYAGMDIVLVTVLKGACIFAGDLVRTLSVGITMDFVQARSYEGRLSSGEPRFQHLPGLPLANAHVLVVEDILDTGRTASAILAHIAALGPASLRICTLLDKPSRRIAPATGDYVGFTIDNHFVVGYGLDFEERHRELPAVYILIDDKV